ncbi:Adhesion G-protein coupled receptor G6 [Anabarilius grahami]|uniref:Adhesion G-protein coupled receptor G6 n=1 Tax=Anabarilius grahami TaxID=495550 RepID=A0A3N0Z266_ANAGA|nr:Adhesion G-protein coupled receptor G6 [Anabarilius grahami]
MNQTVKDIKMWFFQNESECLPSSVLNSTDHCVTCQTTNTPTTTHQATSTPTTTDTTSTTDTITTGCNANNQSPLGKEGSKYVLHFNGSEWMCVICVDERSTTVRPPSSTTTNEPTTSVTTNEITNKPTTSVTTNEITNKPISTLAPPEIIYNVTPDNVTDGSGHIESSKASESMEKMDSLVEQMEKNNKSNAAIVMGDIIGVLQRQAKNTESKDFKICYSPNQNMINVVEKNLNTDFPWSVNVPSEAFDKSRLENNGSAFVGVLRFPNMGNKNEIVLNNEVYGITMGANISNLTNNIEMFIKQEELVGEASCRSWDGKGIFIMIVTKIVQARHIKAADGKRKTFRKQLMMVLSLFLLFGLTWAVAFFSYGAMLIPSYYIFTVLNSFQGFFLFLYYYHIHNDVAGNFSDDPESSSSTTTIVQSGMNAVENIYN